MAVPTQLSVPLQGRDRMTGLAVLTQLTSIHVATIDPRFGVCCELDWQPHLHLG